MIDGPREMRAGDSDVPSPASALASATVYATGPGRRVEDLKVEVEQWQTRAKAAAARLRGCGDELAARD